MVSTLNPRHPVNGQTFCIVRLACRSMSALPVLLEVFMMCGRLRRLSLDAILNLNLPLLACKQGDEKERTQMKSFNLETV